MTQEEKISEIAHFEMNVISVFIYALSRLISEDLFKQSEISYFHDVFDGWFKVRLLDQLAEIINAQGRVPEEYAGKLHELYLAAQLKNTIAEKFRKTFDQLCNRRQPAAGIWEVQRIFESLN